VANEAASCSYGLEVKAKRDIKRVVSCRHWGSRINRYINIGVSCCEEADASVVRNVSQFFLSKYSCCLRRPTLIRVRGRRTENVLGMCNMQVVPHNHGDRFLTQKIERADLGS
jgi:hypothetical protein